MRNIQFFLSLAAQEALKGMTRKEGGPFGTVLVKKNRILAKAHNTVLKTNNPTCHAEINAIRLASKKRATPFFNDCIMVCTTEPCPMCFSAIHWGRFELVVFSTTIQDVRALGFNELRISAQQMKKWGKSKTKIKRVSNTDCSSLLLRWQNLPHQKTY